MRMKKSFIVTMAMLLILSLFPPYMKAESKEKQGDIGVYSTKDEVIYGKLSAHGKLNNMYVVNSFNITKPGTITDYGHYSNLRNLTNLFDIEQAEENEINFYADNEEYFYQGELSQPTLPWDVTIRYLLDGKEIQANELAGQSGALDIQITTVQNEKVNPLFFENYLLQFSVTLDPTIFSNIHAPKGTEANEGKNKLMTFTVMPDTEEHLIITADVEKLELDPIQISAIPANIAIDDLDMSDMTEDMKELSSAISDLHSGVGELRDGVKELTDGTKKLNDGSTDYMKGMNELNQSSGDLVDGSRDIRDVLQHVSTALQDNPDMPDLDDMDELITALNEMVFGLREIAKELETLQEFYDGAHGALSRAIDGIPDSTFDEAYIESQIGKMIGLGLDESLIMHLTETYKAAQIVKGTYHEVEGAFTTVSNTLQILPPSLTEIAEGLDMMADELESGLKQLDQLDMIDELIEGLTTLSSEYSTFHDGLVTYTEGVNSLADHYKNIDSGIKELSDGTTELYDGIGELYEGTTELEAETRNMPEEMESEVDKLLDEFINDDFEPVSFVSDQNEHIGVVQFVLQTERIEVDEKDEEETKKKESKGLWQRFLDLFR